MVPCGIIINKQRGNSRIIEEYAANEEIPILLKLAEDRRLAEAYSRGEPAIHYFPELKEQFREVYFRVCENLKDVQAMSDLKRVSKE